MQFSFTASCLLIFSLPNPSAVSSARILAMLLSSAPSHHNGMFQPLLRALVEAGHEVVAYTPRPMNNPPANYKNVFVEEFLENEESELLDLISNHYMTCADNFGNRALDWFDKFINNKQIQILLNNTRERFDLLITEPFLMQEFTLILGQVFKVPMVAVSTFASFDYVNSAIGNSLEIASIPEVCAPRTNQMSFTDRARNAYEILRRLYLYRNHHLPRLENKMRLFFPRMPHLLEMMQNLSLVFVNEHPTVSYARPHLPNVVPVGGVHIGTAAAKPMPEDIRQFMEDAPDGVIFFSLGSLLPEAANTEEFYNSFKHVFGQLRQRVLWKTKSAIRGLPENVKVTPWIPQQDILAHNSCVLFITHGGLHSLFEAVNYGVPIITIPHFADQRSNAMFGVAKGIGVAIERADLSKGSLASAIATVLGDASYAKNAAMLSKVFRDRPQTPAQSVVYWVNHVLRHGGHHLRPPPLPLHKAYLIDVITAASLVSLAALALLVKLYSALTCRMKRWTVGLWSAKKYK